MTQAIDFKVTFLETICAPLLSSIIASNGNVSTDSDAPVKSEAQNMAELLGRSVELSSRLYDFLDLKQVGEKAESIRISLAAVSANLLAYYRDITGKIPDETTLKRLIAAIETSLIFADNFVPGEEHIARLGNVGIDDPALLDVHQINMQYMNIMVPVVLVVADYTFGRDEKKLVLEVCEKLSHKATQMVKSSAVNDDDELVLKKRKLQILRALVAIYTECHRNEKERISDMSDDERARLSEESGSFVSMDNLWHNFSTRLAMLEMIAGMPQEVTSDVIGNQKKDAPIVAEPPQEKFTQEDSDTNIAEDEQEPKEDEMPATGNDNPMSFFTKKPVSRDTGGENTDGTMV